MSKPKISLIQTFCLLVGLIIGAGILNLPASLAKEMNQDGWVGALIGGIITIILLNIALSLLKKYPDKNYFQIARHLLGKYLGNAVNLIFLTYFLILAGLSLRISTSTISSWVLPKTPLEVLIISFIFAAFYLTRSGLQVAARFSEIIVFILIPFSLVIFLPIGKWELINILPIGEQPLSNYFSGTMVSIFAYLGFEIIVFFYPFIQASHKKIRQTTNVAILFTIFIYASLTFGVLASFGPERLQDELFVTLKYSQFVRFAIIERVDFFLIFFWNFALFHTFSLLFYFSYAMIEDIFSITKNHWSALLAIPLYYIALYPNNISELNQVAGLASNFGFLSIIFTLFLFHGLSFFKK